MKTLQDSINEIKNSDLYHFKLKLDKLINEANVFDNITFALKYLENPSSILTTFDDGSKILLRRYLNKKSLWADDDMVPEELLKDIHGDHYLILTVDLKELGRIDILIFTAFNFVFKPVAKILHNHLEETEETYDKLYNHIASFLDSK